MAGHGLAATLRTLREAAGFTETAAAQRAGLTQAKVSRLESGLNKPSLIDIRALARVYQAAPDVAEDLERMANEMRAQMDTKRVVLHRGRGPQQARIGRIEASAERIRSFHPTVVLGILQTAAYARAIFDSGDYPDDPEEAVTARTARAGILGTDREFTLLMTEGTLRWCVVSPEVMAAQLNHITEASRLDNVSLGIIPWGRPARVLPLNGFHLYDAHTAIVGTETGMAVLDDSADIALYEDMFAKLTELADFGDDARAAVDRVAADYRNLA